MERQGLSERGSTVDAERIRGLYDRADPSKRPHDGDELLDVVCGVVADEGERGDQTERLELRCEGLAVADRVCCTVFLCPLDRLRTRGGDDDVVDAEDLGKGGGGKSRAAGTGWGRVRVRT